MSAADHLTNAAAYGISPLPATPNHATLLNHSTTNKSPQRTDRLEVCREFKRGNCKRLDADCRYAHPPDHVQVDSNDGLVTVCMDFIKGRCSRDTCRYMHPPPHLQAQLKARSNSNASAGVGGSGVAGIGNHLQQDGSNHSIIPSPILSTQAPPPPPNQPQLLPLTALPHHHPLTLAAAAAAASSASRPYRLWKNQIPWRKERKSASVSVCYVHLCWCLSEKWLVDSLTDKLHIVMYSRTLGIFDTGDGTHKQIDRYLSNSANPPSERRAKGRRNASHQESHLSLCFMSPPSVQYSPHHTKKCRVWSLISLPSVIIHSLSPPSYTERESDRHTFTCHMLILVHLFFSPLIRLFFQILFPSLFVSGLLYPLMTTCKSLLLITFLCHFVAVSPLAMWPSGNLP